jgi:DDE_Tnp_1-associated/DDE superfamily endonuclease
VARARPSARGSAADADAEPSVAQAALASVPDPRARRGVRHRLTVVLTAAVCAVVAGCCSYTAIAEWVADLPEQTAGRLGIDARRRPSEADGSLLPCWSWASQPGLYSGKHQTTGLSVQVACTLAGNLAWVSDAINGARPDSFALHDSEALVLLDPGNWIGDKGYVGNGMLTPYKKPAGGELKEWQKECNSQSTRFGGSSSKSSPT